MMDDMIRYDDIGCFVGGCFMWGWVGVWGVGYFLFMC